jgi:hypothetical protein
MRSQEAASTLGVGMERLVVLPEEVVRRTPEAEGFGSDDQRSCLAVGELFRGWRHNAFTMRPI